MVQGFQSVQPEVDDLAARLARAVLVDDRELNALCWSAQQDVDAVRRATSSIAGEPSCQVPEKPCR